MRSRLSPLPRLSPPPSATTPVTETNVDRAASRIKESIKNDDRKTVENKIRAELRAFGIRF